MNFLALLFVGVILLSGLSKCGGSKAKEVMPQASTAVTQKKIEWSTALERCQQTLLLAARDPETAKIPVVYPMKDGADWRFLWAAHTKQVRMRNGLGAEVAVNAFCVVDEDTGKIKLLTLDGKQLITPGA